MTRQTASDLCMIKIAISDARTRIAQNGGSRRDHAILARFEKLSLTVEQRRQVGLSTGV